MAAYVDSTGVTNLTADIKALADATYPANEAIAEEYDSTTSYAIDDYCLHAGLLYKCTTAITVGESWAAAHWIQVDISTELKNAINYTARPLIFTNVIITTNQFVDDETFWDYPYRVTIALSGVTSNHFPEIIFAYEDAINGVYAPQAQSYSGGVYIYAYDIPSESVTIPKIVCWLY